MILEILRVNVTKGLILCALVFSTSSCAVFNYYFPDKRLNYQDHQSLPELNFPDGIETRRIDDQMPVPDISDDFENVTLPEEVDRPAPLKVGLMQLGIQKRSTGDRHWIFVDKSASRVWPELEEFFKVRNISLRFLDPRKGLAETQWLDDRHVYLDTLKKDIEDRNIKLPGEITNISAYRFLVYLQPGLQRNTSRLQLVVTTQKDQWPKASDSSELEELILDDLTLFLGERLSAKSSVSLLAREMTRSFTVDLVNQVELEPYLLINQDFNQGWYLVSKGVREADMPLFDLNRSLGLMYLSTSHEDSASYAFARAIKASGLLNQEKNHEDFQLSISEGENGIEVRVQLSEETPADREFSLYVLEALRNKIKIKQP